MSILEIHKKTRVFTIDSAPTGEYNKRKKTRELRMNFPKRLLAILALDCVAALAACSGGPPAVTPPADAPASVTIEGTYSRRYLIGEKFDPTGMRVVARYSGKAPRYVTDYEISPDRALTAEDTSVTITYHGVSVTKPISVGIDPLTTATLDKMKNEFEKKTFEKDGYTLLYRERKPDNPDGDAPLVLFLHGAGERGNDNELQLKNCIMQGFASFKSELYDAVVLAPQCPAADGWVNCDWLKGEYDADEIDESAALEAAAKLVEARIAQGGVDKNRVYVMGLSMGGYGTWDILLRHGDLFAAGVPICGGADIAKALAYTEKPLYVFHGDADTQVPVSGSRNIVNAIRAQGGTLVHYVEFAGGTHGIWDRAIKYEGDAENPALLGWLFGQTKK